MALLSHHMLLVQSVADHFTLALRNFTHLGLLSQCNLFLKLGLHLELGVGVQAIVDAV